MAEAQKKALVAQLALQRDEVTSRGTNLGAQLSLSHQLKESVRNNPKHWMIGSAVGTIVLLSLIKRKKVVYKNGKKRRGLIRRTASLAFFFARPALATYAFNYARDYAEERLDPRIVNSMLGDPPQK